MNKHKRLLLLYILTNYIIENGSSSDKHLMFLKMKIQWKFNGNSNEFFSFQFLYRFLRTKSISDLHLKSQTFILEQNIFAKSISV